MAGRPKGSHNKSTLAAITLLEGESEALTRKAVELALGGDIQALRLCLDRIVAPVRERPISISLPVIDGVEDAPAFTAALLEAVASGELKVAEASILFDLAEAHCEAIRLARRAERMRLLDGTEITYPTEAAMAHMDEKTTLKDHLTVANIICKMNPKLIRHLY
jgi:hypothetical protein